jgi:hypothetical protein
VSRTNEIASRPGCGTGVGELQGEHREGDATRVLPEQLLLGAQPEAALPRDLDEVVEEADEPSPVMRKSTSSPLTTGL